MKNKTEKLEKEIKNNYKKYLIYIIFFVALAAVIVFAYRLGSDKNKSINIYKYPLLSPLSFFVNQKDMIVDIQDLRNELNTIGSENPNISIYFEFLNTGANITVNKEAQFFPASLLKLPLAMAAVKKIERGEWKWENELVLMGPDKDNRFGDLYKKPIGTRLTIENLIREMLLNSDNTAYLMILRNLEPDEFKNTQNHLGLQDFFSQDGKISAKNYSVILRALHSASYLTQEDSNKLIKIMAETKFKEYLGGPIPENVVFSHKIGVSREEGVHLDAGIVYIPDRPYLLSVMIQTGDKDLASKKMYEISEKVYNYIANYKQIE